MQVLKLKNIFLLISNSNSKLKIIKQMRNEANYFNYFFWLWDDELFDHVFLFFYLSLYFCQLGLNSNLHYSQYILINALKLYYIILLSNFFFPIAISLKSDTIFRHV